MNFQSSYSLLMIIDSGRKSREHLSCFYAELIYFFIESIKPPIHFQIQCVDLVFKSFKPFVQWFKTLIKKLSYLF